MSTMIKFSAFPCGSLFKNHVFFYFWSSLEEWEESFGRPKRNSTEEKLVQSQYNGTRINMIRKDRGNHDESLPVQKSLDIHWRTLSDALLHVTGVPEAACMTEASSLNFYYVKTMAEVQEASPGIGHLFNTHLRPVGVQASLWPQYSLCFSG